jgi:uncharacterized phiE125 gp8 family phage protein
MLTRLEAPAKLPVALDEIKARLRVDHSDEDTLISGFIGSATAHVDGPDSYLGRCLISSAWNYQVDAFSSRIELPIAPAILVTEISYQDANGNSQVLPSDAYDVRGLGGEDGAFILPSAGTSWPQTSGRPLCVSIDFTAGYGTEPGSVPEVIREAIAMHVATLYLNREAVMPEVQPLLPLGYHELLAGKRRWRFS